MCAHALSLSHPGIRCRCLAAYGDAVSAVKWYHLCLVYFYYNYAHYLSLATQLLLPWNFRASRLAREHHDDLAQFMLGMGYATEALHLPGISKRYALTKLALTKKVVCFLLVEF